MAASNIVYLGLPKVPRERWNRLDRKSNELPEGVVWLREPRPFWWEASLAAVTPEMEAIAALIRALDERTPSGKRPAGRLRARVIYQLHAAIAEQPQSKARQALDRLVAMGRKVVQP